MLMRNGGCRGDPPGALACSNAIRRGGRLTGWVWSHRGLFALCRCASAELEQGQPACEPARLRARRTLDPADAAIRELSAVGGMAKCDPHERAFDKLRHVWRREHVSPTHRVPRKHYRPRPIDRRMRSPHLNYRGFLETADTLLQEASGCGPALAVLARFVTTSALQRSLRPWRKAMAPSPIRGAFEVHCCMRECWPGCRRDSSCPAVVSPSTMRVRTPLQACGTPTSSTRLARRTADGQQRIAAWRRVRRPERSARCDAALFAQDAGLTGQR